jgi:hypothetical protein
MIMELGGVEYLTTGLESKHLSRDNRLLLMVEMRHGLELSGLLPGSILAEPRPETLMASLNLWWRVRRILCHCYQESCLAGM